mmetsp:Transcript_34885/g.42808  ORF Transcript_34885/g.42808 Transcript_34885/m.42808 type:complete len:81 (+) Transcript_34885:1807-2049(+)
MNYGKREETEQLKARADTLEWQLKKTRGLLLASLARSGRNSRLAKRFYQLRGQLFSTPSPADNDSRSDNKAALYEQLTQC